MAFKDDKATLIGILSFAENLLGELTATVKQEVQGLFNSAWNEVKVSIEQLRTQINTIQQESDTTWEKFKERGLTGAQLALKRALLVTASNNGLCKDILEILNIILGSIPGADSIKEYKELLEKNLGDPNQSVNAKFS